MEDQKTYPMNQSEQPTDEETVICDFCGDETPKSKAYPMYGSKYLCEYCFSAKTVYAGPQKYKDFSISSDSPMAGLMGMPPSIPKETDKKEGTKPQPTGQSGSVPEDTTVVCMRCGRAFPKSSVKSRNTIGNDFCCDVCNGTYYVYGGPAYFNPSQKLRSFIGNDGDTQSAEAFFSSTNGEGTQNRRRCDNCGESVPENAKFCPECGTRLKRICDICGTPAEDDAKFCTNCGQKLP